MTRIFVDGKHVEELYLRTDTAGTDPNPPPQPDPDPPAPEPPPKPDPTVDGVIDWLNPGNRQRIDASVGETVTLAFTTDDDPRYGGQFSVSSVTGNSGLQREVWISRTPEGPPLDSHYAEASGTSSTIVRFIQNPNRGGYTPLETNTRYYLNIKTLPRPPQFPAGANGDSYLIIYNNRNQLS